MPSINDWGTARFPRSAGKASCAVGWLLCLATALSAQGDMVTGAGARPVPPVGGFVPNADLFVPVTYSDGYTAWSSMLWPSAPAPDGGWPLVVFVHPFGASRYSDQQLQLAVASQGYAVWAYDVRAQGQGPATNPGHVNGGSSMWGPAERMDLAEQIQFAGQRPEHAGLVDASRVAVVGRSQGAAHAWMAAAWSGLQVSAPGRAAMAFPQVQCVVPLDLTADPVDDWLRDGQLFSTWLVEAINHGGVPLDAGFVSMCRTAFLNQDPSELAVAMSMQGRAVRSLLQQSAVPVFYVHAYRDTVNSSLAGLEVLEQRAGLRRTLFGGVGHGNSNDLELQYRNATIVRWLNRYLWGEPNEADLDAPHVLSELPADQALAADAQHGWSQAQSMDLRPLAMAPKLFLRDGEMAADAVSVGAMVRTVQQRLVPGTKFTAANYLDDPQVRDVGYVLQVCPLDELVYSHSLGSEQQLVRSARLHLSLVPHQPEWQLTATLSMQEHPAAQEVVLTSRSFASRSSSAGVVEQHDVRLPPIAMRLPAGAVLRLRVSSLALRREPMYPVLDVAPMFTDFRVDALEAHAGGDSWLELPLEPVAPRLVADRATLKLAAPVPVALTLRAGADRAQQFYFGAVGMSGQSPTTPYLNAQLPFEFDWLVSATAGANGPSFFGGLGQLDSAGEATMSFDLSSAVLPSFFNGKQLTFGAFVWDATGTAGAASNAWDVVIL